jgi:hypothetical protein
VKLPLRASSRSSPTCWTNGGVVQARRTDRRQRRTALHFDPRRGHP